MKLTNKKGTRKSPYTKSGMEGGDSMCSTLSKNVDFFAGFTFCARAII
jgi:hypothetical protein